MDGLLTKSKRSRTREGGLLTQNGRSWVEANIVGLKVDGPVGEKWFEKRQLYQSRRSKSAKLDGSQQFQWKDQMYESERSKNASANGSKIFKWTVWMNESGRS